MAKALAVKLVALFLIFTMQWFLPWPANRIGGAAVAVVALGWIGWGVFRVNSSIWARTLWRSPSPRQAVALTFDDGPDPAFTPRVLDILREKGAPAAFFLVGGRADEHPELVRRIQAEGHLVGNHSFSHAAAINFGLHGSLRREIDRCQAVIRRLTGRIPAFYRPPHGFKNPALGDVLEDCGMIAVGWQVRGFDAVRGDAAGIGDRILKRVKPGGVLLLHDGSGLQGTADRSATLEALPRIIDGLRERGLELVRLDDLLGRPAYQEIPVSESLSV